MQWFITLTNRTGSLIFAWLGPLCFLAGMAAIAGGAYALWQSANPRSSWYARKWAPACVMMFGFMLVGFTNLLNLTGVTLGTTGTYGVGMSSYEQVDIGAWSNMTPAQAFVAVLESFKLFWAAIGAAVCSVASLLPSAWPRAHAVMAGVFLPSCSSAAASWRGSIKSPLHSSSFCPPAPET
ncbi:hypothetical protein ACFQY5_41390 [Paeniroseomonas aquatica]|uniref:hypothetical protein n=1 Tax=Paeniroseomonas aquatica TaxID=373043 RepID=UPI003615FC43